MDDFGGAPMLGNHMALGSCPSCCRRASKSWTKCSCAAWHAIRRRANLIVQRLLLPIKRVASTQHDLITRQEPAQVVPCLLRLVPWQPSIPIPNPSGDRAQPPGPKNQLLGRRNHPSSAHLAPGTSWPFSPRGWGIVMGCDFNAVLNATGERLSLVVTGI